MATITTSQMVDTLDANMNELFLDGIERYKDEYSVVFNVKDSTKQTEQDSYLSGFGLMPIKPEGQDASYDTVRPGIVETYTHDTYAMGYEITEEAVEDNLQAPGTFNRFPELLKKSAMETIEVTAFNVFNNGFSTNGFDGTTLFSTSHPTLDGGTMSNRPSTDADLSVTSLTAGLTAFEDFTDERGLKRPTKAAKVLVPTALWNVIIELLDSPYKPNTANNEVNALQEKDLSYMVGHYLTDTDAWFILALKDDTALKFFWRVRLGDLKRGTDFDSTNLKHLARMRFSLGYSYHGGTYGTRGA